MSLEASATHPPRVSTQLEKSQRRWSHASAANYHKQWNTSCLIAHSTIEHALNTSWCTAIPRPSHGCSLTHCTQLDSSGSSKRHGHVQPPEPCGSLDNYHNTLPDTSHTSGQALTASSQPGLDRLEYFPYITS